MIFKQIMICGRHRVMPSFPKASSMVAVARNVDKSIPPLNGMRHLPEGTLNGWFVWTGEDFSDDANYFQPIHVEHMPEQFPEVLPFLALPPGWRFLLAPGHVDVWFDPKLLEL